jgi:hypothetical protein
MDMEIIILGAGVTGLSAGLATGGTVYEKNTYPGGLCASYYKNGNRFEIGGGHWIFGEIPEFAKNFAKFNYYERNASVLIDTKIPYPIQTSLSEEPDVIVGTMKENLLRKFGPVLCNLFFFPFNEKYTGGLYNKVIVQDEYKSPKEGQGYNSTFAYPEGGLDKMVGKMAKEVDVRYGKELKSIDLESHQLTFNDEVVSYDLLISTIPLNFYGYLPATRVTVLNILAEKKDTPKDHWIYTPHWSFHRVGFYSNVFETDKASLYVEGININTPEVIKELTHRGFIGKVIACDYINIDPAYTYKTCMDQAENIMAELSKHNVICAGRYGTWKFQGIAESMKEGYECFSNNT